MVSTTTDIIGARYGGVAVKAPCVTATTAAIALSGLQTIDGVTTVAGDRVLVKDQSSSVDNGIYVASSGEWSRAVDCDGSRDLVTGTRVYVTGGTQEGLWKVTTANPIVVDTTAITFAGAVDGISPENVVTVTAGTSYDLSDADHNKFFLSDDTTDGNEFNLPDSATLTLPWTVSVMCIGTDGAFSTEIFCDPASDTINGLHASMQVPRYRVLTVHCNGTGYWVDDIDYFPTGITIGGQTDANQFITITDDGFGTSRNDNNAIVGFWLAQNFGIGAAGQGARRSTELGAAHVSGATAYREDILSTEDWSVAANRSAEVKRYIILNNTLSQYEYVTDGGQVQWPLQQRFAAHKTANSDNVTGNGATVDVVFGAEDYDIGAGYATGTGIFTAGVAGKYAFNASVAIEGLTSVMVQGILQLVVSSPAATIKLWEGNPYALAGTSVATIAGGLEVTMDAAATAKVQLQVSGGAGDTADIHGHASNHLTRFQGRLVA